MGSLQATQHLMHGPADPATAFPPPPSDSGQILSQGTVFIKAASRNEKIFFMTKRADNKRISS